MCGLSNSNTGAEQSGTDPTNGSRRSLTRSLEKPSFRQRENVDAVDVPEGSVGPTLKRIEAHGIRMPRPVLVDR